MVTTFYSALNAETSKLKADASVFTIADGIVQGAIDYQCDLIFIGSHGRSGFSRLLLGSVTTKVLALTHSPVLVYRVKDEPKK